MVSTTMQELKNVTALCDLPEEHLKWILDHSEYFEYEDGAMIRKTGDAAEEMIIILEGSVSFYMDVKGRLIYYHDFTNDDISGGVTGLLPYSRMKVYPGSSFAVGKVRMLHLHKKYFQELEHLNPDLIQKLIGYMTERARSFATTQMQHEKVNALGQLSAGIAHELNNPASAINRISSELTRRLKLNYELTEGLLRYKISEDNIKNIRSIVETKHLSNNNKLSALQRMNREDEITGWLSNAGYSENQLVSETLAEAGFSSEELENIKGGADKDSFIRIIQWLENLLSSQKILKDLEEASTRISTLVGAIKSHVHMDQTNELQSTNIHNDIENTLTLLGHKFRDKNINVRKLFCDNLKEVPVYVGELNQVWTNLIDNAIYALGREGELIIETTCDDKNVVVKIIDNGAGIPPDILNRIFDPFFTTKKVGEGTGIGLDLVNRIIKHHNGSIKVNSRPGKTEFAVCIPIIQKQ
ncbi:MAG: ATP-binding protein [Ignavibacteriaceae bacterium]|nr:ATP-binding protein [Ignavibacteriaceae bacterium]